MSQKCVRCPKCNTEIRLLVYRYEAEIAEEFFVTEAGEPEHAKLEILPPQNMEATDSYSCPECDTVITTDSQEALRLLTHQARLV